MSTFGQTLTVKELLIRNVKALLADRKIDDKALSMWAGHKPPWISKILAGTRGVQLEDLGKIADFFGLTVAELLTHGRSFETDRRRTTRRAGTDRRSGRDRRGTPREPPSSPPVRFPPKQQDEDET